MGNVGLWWNRAVWKHILDQYLSSFGGMALLLKCNVDMNKFNCQIPHFYAEILKTWFNLNCVKPNTGYVICKQVIWNNRFLMVDNKTVFYKKLYIQCWHYLCKRSSWSGREVRCVWHTGWSMLLIWITWTQCAGILWWISIIWLRVIIANTCSLWKVTIDNRLRWLQYRNSHGILTTNAWLYRFKIINSPIVGFFIFVSTCILERVFFHLKGMCSDHK